MNCGTSSAWWGCPVAQILLFCQLLYLLLLSTAKDITTNLRKVEFMWLNWTFLRGAVFFCFTFTLYTDNNRIILKRKYIIELHKLWAVDECQIYYFSVYGGLETRCCIGWIGYQQAEKEKTIEGSLRPADIYLPEWAGKRNVCIDVTVVNAFPPTISLSDLTTSKTVDMAEDSKVQYYKPVFANLHFYPAVTVLHHGQ